MTQLIKKKKNNNNNNDKKVAVATVEQVQQQQWQHPSELKASAYVECCEKDENELNEALEAKLRQLIVEEYANRPLKHPVSLRIQGHLTITPACHQATFWTADADICWRDNMINMARQKAERQAPRSTF